MANKKTFYEAQITPEQRLAAQTIVDNEFGLLTEDGRKLTNFQLQERLAIGNDTFYRWKRDADFIRYMNVIADEQLEFNRSEVYAQLMRSIRGGANGIPSVKALDLYLRRFGLLTDRTVVEDGSSDRRALHKTDAQVAEEIAQLDDMINGSK